MQGYDWFAETPPLKLSAVEGILQIKSIISFSNCCNFCSLCSKLLLNKVRDFGSQLVVMVKSGRILESSCGYREEKKNDGCEWVAGCSLRCDAQWNRAPRLLLHSCWSLDVKRKAPSLQKWPLTVSRSETYPYPASIRDKDHITHPNQEELLLHWQMRNNLSQAISYLGLRLVLIFCNHDPGFWYRAERVWTLSQNHL